MRHGDLPKDFRYEFKKQDARGKEEKLIVELINQLDEVTYAFLQLNHAGNITWEFFRIIRDAGIGYAGGIIRDLLSMMVNKKHKREFLREVKIQFDRYIDSLEKTLK